MPGTWSASSGRRHTRRRWRASGGAAEAPRAASGRPLRYGTILRPQALRPASVNRPEGSGSILAESILEDTFTAHGALPPYSPRAAFFVVRAPALAVRLVFAAPVFHASFAAFGPPVKKALVERPKVSTPSFAVRPPVLAPSLAAFLTLCRFSSAAAGVTAPSASSAPRTRAVALRLRRPILHHPLHALEPLLICAVERAAEIPQTFTVTRIVAPSMRHTTREPRPSSGDGPPSKRTLLLALNHVGQRSARQSHFHTTSGGAATSCPLATNTGQLAGSRPCGQRGHPARGAGALTAPADPQARAGSPRAGRSAACARAAPERGRAVSW